MDSSLAQVSSSIHRSSALAGLRFDTGAVAASSTTLSSSNGNLTIQYAVNVPQVDMEKPNVDPIPPQNRKKNVWIVVHTFVPA